MKPTRRYSVQLALMALVGFSLPVSAYQPLITDDTGTLGSGGNQLEFAFVADNAETAGNVERLRALPVVYTRGVTETLDVFVGLIYQRIRSDIPRSDVNGDSDPLFGVKWRFYEDETTKTSFAVKPGIIVPVGAGSDHAALDNGKISGNLTFILTREVPFGAIHFNAGVLRNRYRDNLTNPDDTTTHVSIAPVWDVSVRWKLAFDLGTESARAAGTNVRTSFAELGAIYSPSKDLDFSIGIVHWSDNDSPSTTRDTATAGLTWRYR
ncbi:MAG: transporter [Burkholderiales bacterium]|nr:transporter [Burkholderiales bacterium]